MKNVKTLVAFLSGVVVAGAALGDQGSNRTTTAAAAVPAAQVAAAGAPPSRSALWSYQPIKDPEVPQVHATKWVHTPIDALVLAKLEAKGLKPSPEASRAAFARRVTLDTLGFIPTPEAVETFVKDRSPDAYEKLIDGLLASAHHGERLARHWLDLARYADSAGFQNDQTRANAWRYRDYVINAFNDDKPYDQFIKEQLAGDEIPATTREDLIATGFLTQYPDNANARDLLQRKYQITTDMVDTVGQVFLAQTVGCARCHDHKFDKISQKEYFQLQAFFANTSEVNDIPADKGSQEIAFADDRARYQAAQGHPQPGKGDHRPDSRGCDQVPQGALPARQPGLPLQARERVERSGSLGQPSPGQRHAEFRLLRLPQVCRREQGRSELHSGKWRALREVPTARSSTQTVRQAQTLVRLGQDHGCERARSPGRAPDP